MTDNTTLPRGTNLFQPLFVRNFRLLWLGSVLSFMGGQLTLIAFPWLVLKLTGDSLAMGAVLAVAGIPRAVFMLFGGAVTDRFSALTVMIWTNWFRLVLMFGLALLVYTGMIEMWMVFVVAFIFGIADAFYWPASSAIMPKVLPVELLPAGNSLQQGLGQLSQMLGPVLAGIIIAIFSEGQESDLADLLGISVVFFIDGIGFVISLAALSMIRLDKEIVEQGSLDFASMIESIREGFTAAWNDVPVRLITILFAIFSLFYRGPFLVGIPILSDVRFEEGALAYGMITSSFGIGAMLGLLIAGSFPKPSERFLGILILGDFAVLGAGFIAFALTTHLEVAMFFSGLGGLTDGYMVIILISWLQTRIPIKLMGRVMSVIMVFWIGLTPVTAAAAGLLIRWSVGGVFIGAGFILIGLSLIGFLVPVVRRLGIEAERVELNELKETGAKQRAD
ncbi:MAG: MFS transporter [Pseudomonadales bacterium]|nr:MFS transporter [Pseudomonadales bacterium]